METIIIQINEQVDAISVSVQELKEDISINVQEQTEDISIEINESVNSDQSISGLNDYALLYQIHKL